MERVDELVVEFVLGSIISACWPYWYVKEEQRDSLPFSVSRLISLTFYL